ncbi:MAG: hypothetical protein WCG83_05700 [Candidatus Peregrinibacteria bacterium]
MMIASILDRLIQFLIPLALAAPPAQDPCVGIPGGCPAQNVLLNIPIVLGPILVGLAAGGAVLMVVIGGAQMMLAFGDDGAAGKGKMTVIWALCGFALALASQAIITFVQTRASPLAQSNLPTLDLMAAIVSTALTLFNVAFVLVMVYAAFRLVISYGKTEEHGKAWNMLLWAIFGAMVINVAHSLVRAILGIGF